MAGNLKGLTIELAGDTTKLDKALESVNKKSKDLSSELGQVNRLLRLDPGNADLLAQKQQILAEAVENTSQKLETLKEAERQVQAQFERGEVSAEQVRALQREIVDTTNRLGQYENAARETAEAIERLGREGDDGIRDTGDAADAAAADLRDLEDAARDAGDGLDTAGVAVGTFLGDLATNALESMVGFLRDCADAAIEYRTAMGKLDVGFTTNGFSAQAAADAYKEVVGILGETDQAVEASNHLAQLTNSEKELATWTGDILPGVFAVFNDSLPLEGLTEAANETAKVGQVTGPLADAINWVSASTEDWSKALSGNADAQAAFESAVSEGASAEDAFNAALAACNTEQERATLLTEAMNGVYGEASAKYKELNGDVIAANQATDSWNAAMAAAGTAVLPVITSVKEFGAELLERMVPAIQAILDNLPAIGVALAGTAAAVVAFKVAAMAATAATQGMTLAQKAAAAAQAALNVVMSANPIGLVILAITALVTAFMLLWNNSEAFREFWINLWEKIKTAALTAADNLKELPTRIYNSIKSAVDRVKTWGTNLVNTAKQKATEMLTNVATTLTALPGRIWSAIQSAIERVKTWGSNLVSTARQKASEMLSNVASTLSALPERVYKAISGAIKRVVSWGTEMASKARTGMEKVSKTVVNTLKSIPKKVLSIGKDIVRGLWDGINGNISWLTGKISGFASTVLNSVKNFFDINSPSGVFRDEVGKQLVEGMALGVTKNGNKAVEALRGVSQQAYNTAVTEAESYTGIGEKYVENIKAGLEGQKTEAVSAMQALVNEQFAAFRAANGTLQDDYAEVAELIMDSFTEALDAGYDESIEVINNRVSEITQLYQEKYNTLMAAQADMEKKLASTDDLFTFFRYNNEDRVILANLHKDIVEIQNYEAALMELQSRFGMSQSLLTEITALGIQEGTKAANHFLSMTDAAFSEFVAKWEEKQALAASVAKKFYAEQTSALDTAFNEEIKATLESVPDTVKNIGVDCMQGWIDGMNSRLGDLTETVARIARSMIATIKAELSIASPSKAMAWIGDMVDQGLAKGVLDNMAAPLDAMRRVSSGLLSAAEQNMGGIQLERQLSRPAVSPMTAAATGGGLGDKLDRILAAIERGQVLTIDGAALVGATVDRYDATLGRRRELAARGAL